jgi:hypothetical protein
LIADCCASAASGHAIAEPTITLMNCVVALCPLVQDLRRQYGDYSSNLRQAKWGSGLTLHGNNSDALMSATGQKQTLGKVRLMSALPPKADIALGNWHVCFVLLCRARSPAVKREAEEDLSR